MFTAIVCRARGGIQWKDVEPHARGRTSPQGWQWLQMRTLIFVLYTIAPIAAFVSNSPLTPLGCQSVLSSALITSTRVTLAEPFGARATLLGFPSKGRSRKRLKADEQSLESWSKPRRLLQRWINRPQIGSPRRELANPIPALIAYLGSRPRKTLEVPPATAGAFI